MNAHHQRAESSGASRVNEASESCFAAEQEGHRRAGHRGDRSHKQLVAEEVVLTLVSLQSVQAFRLLLKTSVEGNAQEFNQFLVGFCCLAEPKQILFKNKKSTVIYIYIYTHVYTR